MILDVAQANIPDNDGVPLDRLDPRRHGLLFIYRKMTYGKRAC